MIGVHHVRHLPTFVSVEPANFCQLACPECPVGMNRNKSSNLQTFQSSNKNNTQALPGVLSLSDYKQIISKISSYAHTLQLFWQGEPLLNPQLPEMIHIAREAGLYTIVSTNAQALDRPMAQALVGAGLNRIIISMDGWTQQTYEQYRQGGSVDKVKAAIGYLSEAKQLSTVHTALADRSRLSRDKNCQLSTIIELQCLYLRTNEAEWGTFRREYRKLGADRLTMKTAQLYDYAEGSPFMPSDARFARYKWRAREGRYVLKRRLRNRCMRLWSGCVVDIHGNVFPCCYDKNHQYPLGNLLRQSLADIFHGAPAQHFRETILSHRASIPVCTNCDA